MNKSAIKYLFVLPLVMWMAGACSKFEEAGNDHRADYGIAYRYFMDDAEFEAGDNYYFIVRDDQAKLHLKDNLWDNEIVETGDRIKFGYEIIVQPEARSAGNEEYDIKLFYVEKVECHEPVTQSFIDEKTHRPDSIGNDPLVRIRSMEYSGMYVNVIYEYTADPAKDRKHMLSLVVDDKSATEDGVRVELRHNAKGDTPGLLNGKYETKQAEVSFGISSLLPKGKDEIDVTFGWTTINAGDPGGSREVEKKVKFEPYNISSKPIVDSSGKVN